LETDVGIGRNTNVGIGRKTNGNGEARLETNFGIEAKAIGRAKRLETEENAWKRILESLVNGWKRRKTIGNEIWNRRRLETEENGWKRIY
jgi:hypothetical protein